MITNDELETMLDTVFSKLVASYPNEKAVEALMAIQAAKDSARLLWVQGESVRQQYIDNVNIAKDFVKQLGE